MPFSHQEGHRRAPERILGGFYFNPAFELPKIGKRLKTPSGIARYGNHYYDELYEALANLTEISEGGLLYGLYLDRLNHPCMTSVWHNRRIDKKLSCAQILTDLERAGAVAVAPRILTPSTISSYEGGESFALYSRLGFYAVSQEAFDNSIKLQQAHVGQNLSR